MFWFFDFCKILVYFVNFSLFISFIKFINNFQIEKLTKEILIDFSHDKGWKLHATKYFLYRKMDEIFEKYYQKKNNYKTKLNSHQVRLVKHISLDLNDKFPESPVKFLKFSIPLSLLFALILFPSLSTSSLTIGGISLQFLLGWPKFL